MAHRRRFLYSLGTALGLSPFLSLGQSSQKKIIDGRFVHMVFFWLKEETDVASFAKETKNFLEKIPEVRSMHIGQPAGTPREVVDNSYTMSLVVTFDSKEDQDAYQVHEEHLKYVEENNQKWTRVQIYDSWGIS